MRVNVCTSVCVWCVHVSVHVCECVNVCAHTSVHACECVCGWSTRVASEAASSETWLPGGCDCRLGKEVTRTEPSSRSRSPSPPTWQRPPCPLVTSPAHVPPGGRRSEPGLGHRGCSPHAWRGLEPERKVLGEDQSQPGPARRRHLKEEAVEGEAGGADQGQGQEDRWGGSSRGRGGDTGKAVLCRGTDRLPIAGVKSCLGLRPFCFYKSLLLEVLIHPLFPTEPFQPAPPPPRPSAPNCLCPRVTHRPYKVFG